MQSKEPKIRILYVDDEDLLLELTKGYLESKEGISVETCNEPHMALEMIAQNTYDAVVSDYEMPGMDGIGLLKATRANDTELPFIIFTGRGREEVVIEALNAGADSYIQKGGDPRTQFAELANIIRNSVESRRYKADLRMSEAGLLALSDRMTEGVAMVDGQGLIRYSNPSFSLMLDKTSEEIIGNLYDDLVSEKEVDGQGMMSLRLNRPAGGSCWAEVTETKIQFEGENMTALFHRDVTMRREEEKKKAESLNEMKTIFEAISKPVYVSDMDDHSILYANQAMMDLYGPDIVGTACHKTIRGELLPCNDCNNKTLKRMGHSPLVWEFHSSRMGRDFYVISKLMKWTDGRDVRFQVSFDVTELKNAKRDLVKSEQRLSAILKAIPDTLLVIGRDGAVMDVFKYQPHMNFSEASETHIEHYFGPEHSVQAVELVNQVLTEGDIRRFEFDLVTTEGKRHNVVRSVRMSADEVLSVISDVTELHDAMESLDHSERMHRGLFENAPMSIRVLDKDTLEILHANPKSLEFLGYDSFEQLKNEGLPWCESPYAKEDAIVKVKNLAEGKINEFEWQTARRDGSCFWEQMSIIVLPYEGRDRLLNFSIDITESRSALEELHSSRERYKALISASNTGGWEYDLDSDLLWVSKEYMSMLGRDKSDAEAKEGPLDEKWIRLLHPEDRDRAARTFKDYLDNGSQGMYENEFRLSRSDGGWCWISSRGRTLRDEAGNLTNVTVGTHIDITAMKDLENALRTVNEKLSLMSSITRHDIINQLLAATGYLELLEGGVSNDEGSLYIRRLGAALDNISRNLEFTRNYQDLGIKNPEWQNVGNHVLTYSLLKVDVQNEIEDLEILADPLLEKAIKNLVNNSLLHGERVSRIHLTQRLNDEGVLTISYMDDGVGIPYEDKERIFHKGYGKNLGLGLFLIREILSITGISIREVGEPGKGAVFELGIPPGAYRFRNPSEREEA